MEYIWYIIAALGAGVGTGGVLTVLGAAMLILNYWHILGKIDLVVHIFHCLGVLIMYIVPCLAVLIPVRFLTRLPSFIFRKLLHIIAFTCVSLMVMEAGSWQGAALTSVLIAVVVYPILFLLENEPWYARLFVEKRPGEIKTSLLLLFFMFAALLAVVWGIFGQVHLASAAILMWGTGDAAAALIGIPFGKHKIRLPHTDGKKSVEGSCAMLLVAFLAGVAMLALIQRAPLHVALGATGLGALFGTAAELFSPSELDTVTVPVVIAAVLLVCFLPGA